MVRDEMTYVETALEVEGQAVITSSRMVREINEKWAKEYRLGICRSLWGVRPADGTTHLYEAYQIA